MTQNNALGIDMGQIMSNVSNLKTAKQSREQSATKFEHYSQDRKLKEIQAARKAKGSAAMKKEFGIPDELTDDQIATYIALKNDKTAEGKVKLEVTKQRVEMFGNAAAAIQNAQNPVETYTNVRNRLIENYPEMAKDMPERYDPKWVNGSMKLLLKADDILKGNAKKAETETKYKNDVKMEGIKSKNALNLEETKQKYRVEIEDIKAASKNNDKTTTLEKLFNLKKKYKENGEDEANIKVIDDAIKLASQGKASEIDKFLAAELGGGKGVTSTTGTEETNTTKRSASDINKLFI